MRVKNRSVETFQSILLITCAKYKARYIAIPYANLPPTSPKSTTGLAQIQNTMPEVFLSPFYNTSDKNKIKEIVV
jgi:hypothetical protein